jgi:hypothetical protein
MRKLNAIENFLVAVEIRSVKIISMFRQPLGGFTTIKLRETRCSIITIQTNKCNKFYQTYNNITMY